MNIIETLVIIIFAIGSLLIQLRGKETKASSGSEGKAPSFDKFDKKEEPPTAAPLHGFLKNSLEDEHYNEDSFRKYDQPNDLEAAKKTMSRMYEEIGSLMTQLKANCDFSHPDDYWFSYRMNDSCFVSKLTNSIDNADRCRIYTFYYYDLKLFSDIDMPSLYELCCMANYYCLHTKTELNSQHCYTYLSTEVSNAPEYVSAIPKQDYIIRGAVSIVYDLRRRCLEKQAKSTQAEKDHHIGFSLHKDGSTADNTNAANNDSHTADSADSHAADNTDNADSRREA